MNVDALYEREYLINQCLFEMLQIYSMHIDVKEVFDKLGIDSVAIYGMGKVGIAFCNILNDNGISVKYGVDRNPDITIEYLPMCDISSMDNSVDALIVTSEYFFEEIKNEVLKHSDIRVVAILDLLDELLLVPRHI